MNKFIIQTKQKVAQKQWLKFKELLRYTEAIIWISEVEHLSKSFYELSSNIGEIWMNSGSQFLFKYLKEVNRITVRVLASQIVIPSRETYVKLDKMTKLPSIIPIKLQHIVLGWSDKPIPQESLKCNRNVVIALLSIISVYRVLPTHPKVSLDTITKPFNGVSRTLDPFWIKRACIGLSIHWNEFSKLRIVGGESSGPNSYKAVWGCVLDANAFLHHPKLLWRYIRSLMRFSIFFTIWFILISLISLPYYLISRLLFFNRAEMGRLSVVYDQAGKARVVAITNWWIQLLYKPLHLSLFSALSKLETDGTHDQDKPFNRLINKVDPGQTFYGFDLSSATDRLPIDLQIQILNTLKYPGDRWGNILKDIPWLYKDKKNSWHVKYSVGQPMGAYSSWAMLAITHHIIVRIAAMQTGFNNFSDYCILGDDVVIANDAVAERYLFLMETLGVGISSGKSVISKDFTEFAKKLRGKDIDISPIGPGLTLRLIRKSGLYLPRYIWEAVGVLRLFPLNKVIAKLGSCPFFVRNKDSGLVWWAVIIQSFKSYIDVNQEKFSPRITNQYENTWLIQHHIPIRLYDDRFVTVIRQLSGLVRSEIIRQRWVLLDNSLHFIKYGFRTSQVRTGLPVLSDVFYFLISPGSWFYIRSFLATYRKLKEHFRVYFINLSNRVSDPWVGARESRSITDQLLMNRKLILFGDLFIRAAQEEATNRFITFHEIWEFLDVPQVGSINWNEPDKLKENHQTLKKIFSEEVRGLTLDLLINNFNSSLSEDSLERDGLKLSQFIKTGRPKRKNSLKRRSKWAIRKIG